MLKKKYDIIIIGAGSAGLSVGLFMQKLGLTVLMISRTETEIGGDCLNDGCIPSKALIHVAKIIHTSKLSSLFGMEVSGKLNFTSVTNYIKEKQNFIRAHEDAATLRSMGIDIAIGNASFIGQKEIQVEDIVYTSNRIILATGSQPIELNIPGSNLVTIYTNKNIFQIETLPAKFLIIGAGPIGIEIAQAFSRLGSKVSVIDLSSSILQHDNPELTDILYQRLQKEGIEFYLESSIKEFHSAHEAVIEDKNGIKKIISFDSVFMAVGRKLDLTTLGLEKARIEITERKIKVNAYLRTTNNSVYVCGDIAGDLMFSHAAEFHARILIHNFLSPFKKKLNNDLMSWVTYTDPEIATFGAQESTLIKRNIPFQIIKRDFTIDDRAITDNYQYSKLILYISKGGLFSKEKILGGTMIAPYAGELVQELILAKNANLSIDTIFNKIYSYPTASRINQHLIVQHKEKSLTPFVQFVLKNIYKLFNV